MKIGNKKVKFNTSLVFYIIWKQFTISTKSFMKKETFKAYLVEMVRRKPTMYGKQLPKVIQHGSTPYFFPKKELFRKTS